METPFLLILDGMTGAGKSTTAKLLCDKIPRVAHLGMDKVKFFISDFERGQRDNDIAKDIVFSMVSTYFKHNISVILDQPFKSDTAGSELKRYEELAITHGIKVYKVQLYTTPELAFQRVIQRQQNSERQVPEERIKHNIRLFENKEDKGFVVIDTSELSPEEIAYMVFAILSNLS